MERKEEKRKKERKEKEKVDWNFGRSPGWGLEDQ